MSHASLLSPGSHRAADAFDDAALVNAMIRVEVAWLRSLASVGAVRPEHADALATVGTDGLPDLGGLSAATEAAGNPVVPLVDLLRASVGESAAAVVHRGLTSQDVLDTALVLLARDALLRVRESLRSTAHALAEIADRHRDSVMVGRTLTQHAVPITFGLKAARWLAGVLDASDAVDDVTERLPVQCGGAAGTLALIGEITDQPVAVAQRFAAELDLLWPGAPWHTTRSPVTRIGDALVGSCDGVGVIATDVALLSRPEIAEVSEPAAPGRGGSSTMPHKRNPVLSVLIRSAALQAPLLGAQLHLSAAQAGDERPDGAWHSEWPSLIRLCELAVTAAAQCADLVVGLEVDTDAMRRRAEEAADQLLAERGGTGHPQTYLGATADLIDQVLARLTNGRGDHD